MLADLVAHSLLWEKSINMDDILNYEQKWKNPQHACGAHWVFVVPDLIGNPFEVGKSAWADFPF